MDHSERIDTGNFVDADNAAALRLFVVYDSEASNVEAVETSDFVEHELGSDILLDKSFWHGELLKTATLRDEAAREAAEADIILLALSEELEGSTEIRAWVDEWQLMRSKSGGLMAVVPSASKKESTQSFIDYLQEAALTMDMDFLCKGKDRNRQD